MLHRLIRIGNFCCPLIRRRVVPWFKNAAMLRRKTAHSLKKPIGVQVCGFPHEFIGVAAKCCLFYRRWTRTTLPLSCSNSCKLTTLPFAALLAFELVGVEAALGFPDVCTCAIAEINSLQCVVTSVIHQHVELLVAENLSRLFKLLA